MSEHEFSSDFSKILNQISALKTHVSELTQNIKSLEKGVKKKIKSQEKLLIKNPQDLQNPIIYPKNYANLWMWKKVLPWQEQM